MSESLAASQGTELAADCAKASFSTIPFEIVEEIVAILVKLDERERHRGPGRRTLPALLSTSKELRLLALPHLLHKIFLKCYVTNRRQETLKAIILSKDEDLPLGRIAPFIKELYIDLNPGKDFDGARPVRGEAGLHIRILEAMRAQSSLTQLHVSAFVKHKIGIPSHWKSLVPKSLHGCLVGLLELPTMKTFQTSSVSQLPASLFTASSFNNLKIARSLDFGMKDATGLSTVSNPHITSLSLSLSSIPHGLVLPSLEELSVSFLSKFDLDELWSTLTSSCKRLRILMVNDGFHLEQMYEFLPYVIPESVNIGLLPSLESFDYMHTHDKATFRKSAYAADHYAAIFPQAKFFDPHDVTTCLKSLNIAINARGKSIKRMQDVLSWLQDDSCWGILDLHLSGPCYPDLVGVSITLNLSIKAKENVYSRVEKAVETALRKLFPRLGDNTSVTLEIKVDIRKR